MYGMTSPNDHRKQVIIPPKLRERIVAWAKDQLDEPNESEAIRRLIIKGLEETGHKHDRLARMQTQRAQGMTMQAIGQVHGISKARVSQILKRAANG